MGYCDYCGGYDYCYVIYAYAFEDENGNICYAFDLVCEYCLGEF